MRMEEDRARTVRKPAEDEARERERERERRREKERDLKRMPSGGEALAGAGRSAGRAEGERVLLPARKLTVKRSEDAGAGASGRTMVEAAEERTKRDVSPQKRGESDEPLHPAHGRVLLPARKVTRRRAGEVAEELQEGRSRAAGSREASPVKESDAEIGRAHV